MTVAVAVTSGGTMYEAVIGLEVHAQLLTASKIFCGCSTSFGASANAHVCPVCLGFPGSLPVLNAQAVDHAVRASLALGCRVNETSVFARKNYFYPDLPKGYQISQYDRPLASEGVVTFAAPDGERTVRITRVHMEEDAGKSLHEGYADSDRRTYVDYNRGGTPLVEIVTEPDLRSAADAAAFFSTLRSLLVWVGVNDGNMEEGSLRCDANVSVRPAGTRALGTKVEVKNVNSFRFLQKAIEYEIERQVELIGHGGRVVQETRLFDASTGATVSMRSKEEAHDYRYFPEPDLPPLVLDAARRAHLTETLPELPAARRDRFVTQYGLSPYDAAFLTDSREAADYFEAAIRLGAQPKMTANWMMGDLARMLNERRLSIAHSPIQADRLAELLRLIERATISGAIAKQVFERMLADPRGADAIVAAEGLSQIDDAEALSATVESVLAEHADAVAQYRSGKVSAIGFLVGQVMKRTGGKANPKRVNELLVRALGA